jgi:hypothetical protein
MLLKNQEIENTLSADRALDPSISLWQYVIKSQCSNCLGCFLLQTIIGSSVAIMNGARTRNDGNSYKFDYYQYC